MAIHAESSLPKRESTGLAGLLRKDWAVFIPRDRFLIALVYLLAHPMVLPSEEAFFWLGIALAGALVLYVPIMHWHQETDRMLSSLPVSRTTVVFSRYLSSVIACGVAGVAWISTGHLLVPLLSPLLDGAGGTPGMWATFEGILTFFTTAGLLITLFLPMYFRFGLGRGATVFMASSLGLFVFATLRWGFFAPGAALETRISALTMTMGPGWVLFLILGGMGVLLTFSSRLSGRWLKRRDL